MGKPGRRVNNGQVRGLGMHRARKLWVFSISRTCKTAAEVIAAFLKAFFELIAELIRGEIKQDKQATDSDPAPKTLRDRFRAKLRNQLRDK